MTNSDMLTLRNLLYIFVIVTVIMILVTAAEKPVGALLVQASLVIEEAGATYL